MAPLDHLVLASPDPLATRAAIAERTGVLLAAGGAHVGRGTRNWLGHLGPGRYLELIGPDPEQTEPLAPRPFGVDDISEARLVTWCARADDLDDLRGRAAAAEIEFDAPFAMTRDAPGGRLQWRLCLPRHNAGGIVPFFIEWADCVHPSRTAINGLSIVELAAEHPDPGPVRSVLDKLGVELSVTRGPSMRLMATLRGPAGDLRLGGPAEAARSEDLRTVPPII